MEEEQGILFNTYEEFEKYMKEYYHSGCFSVSFDVAYGMMMYKEVWLLDVDTMKVKILYDNYSHLSDVTQEHEYRWMSFSDFVNKEFYKFICKIVEV